MARSRGSKLRGAQAEVLSSLQRRMDAYELTEAETVANLRRSLLACEATASLNFRYGDVETEVPPLP